MPNSTPIIILGSPRSGTTFLGNLLKEHSTLFYAEEYRFTWLYQNEKYADMLRPRHASSKVKKYIRNKFFSLVGSNNKSRLLEKTPSNALRPFFVDEIFPNAKYLYITRDPSECILSIRDLWSSTATKITSVNKSIYIRRLNDIHISQYKYIVPEIITRIVPKAFSSSENLWGPRLPGFNKIVQNLGLFEACCMQWRFCHDELENFHKNGPRDRILKLKLENLNIQVIKDILKFCDLPEENLLDVFCENFTKNPSGLRMDSINDRDAKILQRWIPNS